MSRLRAPAPAAPAHLQPARSGPPSHSSSTSHLSHSLHSVFLTLTPSDIAFFDEVIARVDPSDAGDFGALKRAYEHTRALPLPLRCDEARDAHLWDKTLSLIQVRGNTWRERWDAVRVSLGLQEGSETEESERGTWDETGERTREASGSSDDASLPAAAAANGRPRLSEAQHTAHAARDTKWKAIDGSSSEGSATSDETAHPHHQQQPASFRAQIDSLAARARALSLASSAITGNATPRHGDAAAAAGVGTWTASAPRPARPQLPPTKQLRAAYVESEASSSSGDDSLPPPTRTTRAHHAAPAVAPAAAAPAAAAGRRARFSEPPVQPSRRAPLQEQEREESRESSPTPPPYDALHAPSARNKQPHLLSALDRLSLAQQQQQPARASSPAAPPPSSEADEARTQRQRRLDTVLSRSRAERAALAASAAARQLALEEAQLAPLVALADVHYARRALVPALVWWARKTEQMQTRERNAQRAGEVVRLASVFAHWRAAVRKERQRREEAERVGRVRCALTAWRVWRRRTAEREEKRREERLGVLRGAYAQIKRGREERIRGMAWTVSLAS